MPKEKPLFTLHVEGKEDWSFADIIPNHKYEGTEPNVAMIHNELMESQCKPPGKKDDDNKE